MKNLKTKLLGFLRWLCVGRRRHSDDGDAVKQQRMVKKKIHPWIIDDMNTAYDDIKEKEITGLSGVELSLERNPEKEFAGPSRIELLHEYKEFTSGIELLVEPNSEKEIIGPSGIELLLGPNLEKEITKPSGTELEPNQKEITESSGIELLLEPNLEKEITEPSGNELEPMPKKEISESSGIELEPNLEEVTAPSGVGLLLEPNPENEFIGPSGIELLLEPNPEKEFTYQDLRMLTDNFAREISSNNFGKLYAGRIPDGWKGMEGRDVTIKMWNHDTRYRSENWDTLASRVKPNDALNRMASEINILSQPEMESHPNLPTVKGYCFEEKKLGVVYDIEPKRTLRDVVGHGSLTWALRIKLALGLAHLLEFLHRNQPQFLVRNLAASHIMLDKDWNPILVDCSMLVGGGFGDTRKVGKGVPFGSHGYAEVFLCFSYEWTEKSDVYSYGMILLELLFKRRFDAKIFRGGHLDCFARGIYRKFAAELGESKFSFTNVTNLGTDDTFVFSDGAMLSKLAVQCVNFNRDPRPSMTEIIGELEKLQVSKKLAAV